MKGNVIHLNSWFSTPFRGKPEWQKVASDQRCTTNNCCLHYPKKELELLSSDGRQKCGGNIHSGPEGGRKDEISWRRGKSTDVNSYCVADRPYAKKAAAFVSSLRTNICILVRRVATYIHKSYLWIQSAVCYMFHSNDQSTTPSEPKKENLWNKLPEIAVMRNESADIAESDVSANLFQTSAPFSGKTTLLQLNSDFHLCMMLLSVVQCTIYVIIEDQNWRMLAFSRCRPSSNTQGWRLQVNNSITGPFNVCMPSYGPYK